MNENTNLIDEHNDELTPIEPLSPFKRIVLSLGTLPSAFYNTMTYYESLVYFYEYLKNEVIPTVNNNGQAVEELQAKYIELKSYIDNYFENLDVQEEINAKLDEMALDGTLTNLIKDYVDPIFQEYEIEINGLINIQNNEISNFKTLINNQINHIDEKVTNATAGSPKGVYATVSDLQNADPDHDYIYVVTADGKWYYYDSTLGNWTAGGIYQASEDSTSVQQLLFENKYTNQKINNLIKNYNDFVTEENYPLDVNLFEQGGINASTGENAAYVAGVRSITYLNFNDLTRALRVTTNPNNYIITIYRYSKIDSSFLGTIQATSVINRPRFLYQDEKYRILINTGIVVTSVSDIINTIKISLVYENRIKNDDIFKIEKYNLIDSKLIYSGLIDATTGIISYDDAGTGGYTTCYVPLEEETTYSMSEVGFYTGFYDANDSLIGVVHKANQQQLTNPFTTPTGTKYMLTVKSTSAINNSAYVSRLVTSYYTSDKLKISVNSNIIAPDKPALLSDIPSNVLKNKVIDVFGDSISSTDYTTPYWGQIIATNTGCTINNYGISGTTLAHTNDRHLWDYHFTYLDPVEIGYNQNDPSTWSTGNCFCERFTKVDSSADAIVIMGGTNDNSVPLGTWNSTDTATFYGALNTLLDGISKSMNGKKILVCTPIQPANEYNSNIANPLETLLNKLTTDTISIQLRAQAIKIKCEQYGIECIDLYNMSGINGCDNAKIYYRPNDGIHPSSYGQNRIATIIQSKLEELFKN